MNSEIKECNFCCEPIRGKGIKSNLGDYFCDKDCLRMNMLLCVLASTITDEGKRIYNMLKQKAKP